MPNACRGDDDLVSYVLDVRSGRARDPVVLRHLEVCGRCRRRITEVIAPGLARAIHAYCDEMIREQPAAVAEPSGATGRAAWSRPGVSGVLAFTLVLVVTPLLAVAAHAGGISMGNSDHLPQWSQPVGPAWLQFGLVLLVTLILVAMNVAMIAGPRLGAFGGRLALCSIKPRVAGVTGAGAHRVPGVPRPWVIAALMVSSLFMVVVVVHPVFTRIHAPLNVGCFLGILAVVTMSAMMIVHRLCPGKFDDAAPFRLGIHLLACE